MRTFVLSIIMEPMVLMLPMPDEVGLMLIILVDMAIPVGMDMLIPVAVAMLLMSLMDSIVAILQEERDRIDGRASQNRVQAMDVYLG